MNIEHVSEETMDALYEARRIWARGDYAIATHSIGMIAMDEALDDMNAEIQASKDFERVFGQ